MAQLSFKASAGGREARWTGRAAQDRNTLKRKPYSLTTQAVPMCFRAIKDLAISHCNGRSEIPGSEFSGRTLCQLAPQNDDYQTEKNVARTVDDPRARRRRADARGAKTACGSTHNAHVVCKIHLQRPGSRQLARPCRSKMRGVSAVPRISSKSCS